MISLIPKRINHSLRLTSLLWQTLKPSPHVHYSTDGGDEKKDKDSDKKVPTKSKGDLIQDDSKTKQPKPYVPPPAAAGEYKNPIDILKQDFDDFGKLTHIRDRLPVPRETDIAIIGAGAIGLATAYWLKSRNPRGLNVAVIERDPGYSKAASVLSVGGIRQQFSLPENIQLSMFSAKFLREIKEHLSILDLEPPDIQFNPQGYLFLATKEGKSIMDKNHETQKNLDAKVQLMNQEDLQQKFPWMNVDDIVQGSYGLENEGWFDPWLLLSALKAKCASLGVEFVKGEAVGFQTDDANPTVVSTSPVGKKKVLHRVMVRADNDVTYPMTFCMVVNAAGPWMGEVGRLAGIGTGGGALAVPITVEPRKRYVYLVHCPSGPGLDMPFLVDPSGVYVRREGLGGQYLCGVSPTNLPPGDTGDDVDPRVFYDSVLPVLEYRVPAFKNLELKSAWAGYYDFNYFDENLIIGNHPYFRNFFMAGGCSGHGIQQAIGIGHALMELMIDDEFITVDLSRFTFDRILNEEPVFEKNCV